MRFWLKVASWIDRLNEKLGVGIYWLSLTMVLIGAYNAVARYFDRFTGWGLSSNMYIELQWYLFSLLFLLGAAYTLKHNSHVRVDVFYGRLSQRGKAWVNVLGTVLFLFPLLHFDADHVDPIRGQLMVGVGNVARSRRFAPVPDQNNNTHRVCAGDSSRHLDAHQTTAHS